jgi:IclR family transcriptional regulator, KDG regulon repressor
MRRVPGPGISRMTRRTQAVESAVRVLDLFSLSSPELSLKQVCDQLHANASTVHRLLKAMEETQLVVRVAGTDLYRLGPKLMTLGSRALLQFPVREIAAPYMRRLSEELGETISLSRYEDGRVVYLECVEGPGPLGVFLRVGSHAPAHRVSTGLAQLAFGDPAEVERLIARGLEWSAERPMTPEGFRRHLAEIRERGYAAEAGTGLYRVGVAAVGAAILNSVGRPAAGMAVVGLASDPGMQDLASAGKRVREVADEVTRLLGHPSNGSRP